MNDIDQPSPESSETPEARFARAIAALKERCVPRKIDITEEKIVTPTGEDLIVSVHIPNGRVKRRVFRSSFRVLERILEEPFERVTFLGDYDAICDYEGDYVEAFFRPSRLIVMEQLLARIFGKDADGNPRKSLELFSKKPETGQKVVLGPSSSTIRALVPYLGNREQGAVSIRLSGFGMSTHDQAVSLLEKVATSIFFQVDLEFGTPIVLQKSRASNSSRFTLKREKTSTSIGFPTSEYETEPLMLYFYGRSASQLPLLQFLAFYQVLEYYFPKFSQIEARKRATIVLKSPGFDCHREADVVRLVSNLSKLTGKGFGDERSQLRATISEIVTDEELRKFYMQSDESVAFFTKSKETTTVKIPPAEESDLRAVTAERIYDIRCKIVHSKSDSEGDSNILPFSRQATHLYPDIELLSLLAQKALIYGSASLKTD